MLDCSFFLLLKVDVFYILYVSSLPAKDFEAIFSHSVASGFPSLKMSLITGTLYFDEVIVIALYNPPVKVYPSQW